MIPCMKPGCHRWFRNKSGLTQHINIYHPVFLPINIPAQRNNSSSDRMTTTIVTHPQALRIQPFWQSLLDKATSIIGTITQTSPYLPMYYLTGQPCDSSGNPLPVGQSSPQTPSEKQPNDWSPYSSHLEFELADFLFTCSQMSAANINNQPVFKDSTEMYKMIDCTILGDVQWENFCISYTGEQPTDNVPSWMNTVYDIWFRDPKDIICNMLSQPDFSRDMDYQLFWEYESATDKRQWEDFMSGDWVWTQADIISHDSTMHGSTFIPIILGSDKTTMSVATGQNDYYPLYLSIGNMSNKVCHAHCNSVALIAFLAIPHTDKEHASTDMFRQFRHQLFHSSLTYILRNLEPAMTKPTVMWFGDGHYCHVIFGLSPYITNYEEQVLLACIVCLAMRQELDTDALYQSRKHAEALIEEFDLKTLQDAYGIVGDTILFTSSFPRANIYQLIAPDILHQIIKGTFKDHLVEWVESYLKTVHGTTKANVILDDIDRRIAAVAPFTGLRRFPEGRHFKQWTGNDSKALMKVYLPAIEGHVPTEIVQTFHALLEFTYLVRRNVLTEETLVAVQDTIDRFHKYREIFRQSGTIQTFSLPHQHAMKHYPDLIHLFGALNGLCTSITESKHIDAVKDPYRRTNCNKPLGQMLIINQHLDKLAASRRDFNERGMLEGNCLMATMQLLSTQDGRENGSTSQVLGSGPHNEDNGEAVDCPTSIERARTVTDLAIELGLSCLPTILEEFLLQQANAEDYCDLCDIPLSERPIYGNKITIVNSAAALFYVPSDISGIGGMRHEYIRSCHSWQNGPPRYDCAFVNINPGLKGMHGLDVVRILGFFSFISQSKRYPCAVVQWFDRVGDDPDVDTGMWIVHPALTANRHLATAVIHVDTIYHAAHLVPLYSTHPIPRTIKPHHSYDAFTTFYVNRFIDHHAFSLLSDSYL
ncbi:hypothetical protein F5J12DRAFT_907094 [Pisolithus orientalis]|uniref:uncharacterized protein n=1 Tax=Pisolithus orientalis TaxID=936130 RepID=UPI0022244B3B|nr:uncharacterized protein F5J12DRAFT_907094 [Pisolithus orientalis]KAI5996525.1 hypothetical protein F5J12DRAFT_907094 [Pisolithus orientalis]